MSEHFLQVETHLSTKIFLSQFAKLWIAYKKRKFWLWFPAVVRIFLPEIRSRGIERNQINSPGKMLFSICDRFIAAFVIKFFSSDLLQKTVDEFDYEAMNLSHQESNIAFSNQLIFLAAFADHVERIECQVNRLQKMQSYLFPKC